MLSRKYLRLCSWITVFLFLFSLEGVTVFAQEILDSAETQAGHQVEAPGQANDAQGDETSGGTDGGTAPVVEDEVTVEKLDIPSTDGVEYILADPYDFYNIPSSELSADTGRSGPCGPYAMTSALKGRGDKITYQEVLDAIKPQDFYTTPMEMVRFALDRGYSIRRCDNYTIDGILEIIRETKQSVVCFVHTSALNFGVKGEQKARQISISEPGIQHWVNVVGVGLKDGLPCSLLLKDAYWSHSCGSVHEMPVDEFDFRWKEMQANGEAIDAKEKDLGYIFDLDRLMGMVLNPKRLILKIGSPGTVDFSDRLAACMQMMGSGEMAAEGVATGYKSIIGIWEGLQTFFKTGNASDLLKAVNQLATSVVKVVMGVAGFIVAKVGELIQNTGDFLSNKARQLWDEGGILGKIAAVPVAILGGCFQLLGGVITAISTIATNVVVAIANVLTDICDKVSEFVGKIGETLNPANWFK